MYTLVLLLSVRERSAQI